MSDQPKPTGEWTAQRISELQIDPKGKPWREQVAEQLNAALAAERELGEQKFEAASNAAYETFQKLKNERRLLAELRQEKIQNDLKLVDEIQQLRQQLKEWK